MRQRVKMVIAGTAVVGAALGSTGVAVAGSDAGEDDDSEAAISGDAYDQAATAALDHTGGGRVTGTEVGDEESYYEVEVTLDNGSQVDVQLDEGFNVVTSNPDEADDSD